MFLHVTRIALALVIFTALPSCALPKWKKIPRATPVRFPRAEASRPTQEKKGRQVGTILMVNNDGNFVLIDSGGWQLPQPGAALKCFRGEMEIGVIAVGNERQGAHVVADIVTGKPQKGDRVLQ